jgi:hypothetical protein
LGSAENVVRRRGSGQGWSALPQYLHLVLPDARWGRRQGGGFLRRARFRRLLDPRISSELKPTLLTDGRSSPFSRRGKNLTLLPDRSDTTDGVFLTLLADPSPPHCDRPGLRGIDILRRAMTAAIPVAAMPVAVIRKHSAAIRRHARAALGRRPILPEIANETSERSPRPAAAARYCDAPATTPHTGRTRS